MRLGILAIGATLFIAGCGAQELSAIPVVSVSSSGEVMTGTITPRMDFTGKFSVTSAESGAVCSAETSAEGIGKMTCTDGRAYDLAIPKPPYGRFNGATVLTYSDGDVAVGWGRDANIEKLKAMLGG